MPGALLTGVHDDSGDRPYQGLMSHVEAMGSIDMMVVNLDNNTITLPLEAGGADTGGADGGSGSKSAAQVHAAGPGGTYTCDAEYCVIFRHKVLYPFLRRPHRRA